jgi:hypothetical protein
MKAYDMTSNAAAKIIESVPPELMKTAHLLAGKIALPLIRSARNHMLHWAEDLKSVEALLETFQHEPKASHTRHSESHAPTHKSPLKPAATRRQQPHRRTAK